MKDASTETLLEKINDLEIRLAESEQLVEAIQNGEVDAFAISRNDQPEIYTLQSGDYAYRLLIEEVSEGAINVTEDGLIVYTNTYFHQLINRTYDEVVGSDIFDLIAEESKESFSILLQQALNGKSKGEIILKGDGVIIPVYVSFTSLKPALNTIGIIISDLTEKKKGEKMILQYQQDLEARNIELSQSNGELASFAYIASHDLQEPLRKIHTFSNLILEKELKQLSAPAREYFQRILNAEMRMRTLIDDLLSYSRVNNTNTLFIRMDLNKVLAEVTDDLKEIINESGAQVIVKNLPASDIVPHQLIQLFSNLILNAIKFRKPETNPVITISAQKVLGSSSNPVLPGDKPYWLIDVTDNGIGFDNSYATKIFELFQRLHGKAEFQGTGIGLAICKKIVQNHKGFIVAKGVPGEGAVFSIYFPAD